MQPEEAIFVDDMIENVDAARRVGLIGIHYTDLELTLNELNRALSMGDDTAS